MPPERPASLPPPLLADIIITTMARPVVEVMTVEDDGVTGGAHDALSSVRTARSVSARFLRDDASVLIQHEGRKRESDSAHASDEVPLECLGHDT